MELVIEIDAEQVTSMAAAMKSLRPRLLAALRPAVDAAAAIVLLKIKQKVSGEVLNVRTGNLRRGWQLIRARREGDAVSGGVGTNVEYDPYHEFGFRGTEQVRAHTRQLKGFARVYAIPERRSRRVRTFSTVFVQAHSRTVDYAARPHARPALEESAEAVRSKIAEVVRHELAEKSA